MSATRNISQDNLLESLHHSFIKQVNESGVPLWYIHLYDNALLYEEVERNRDTVKININPEDRPLPF